MTLKLEELKMCKGCQLFKHRSQPVPGKGSHLSEVMLIGEAPGADEDKKGIPFCGKAGETLDKLLNQAGLEPYITNTIKCRPPRNRDPYVDEVKACYPWLQQEIATLQPKIIVCLGRVAARCLIHSNITIQAIRGKFVNIDGLPLIMPTYHPAAIIYDKGKSLPLFEDLKKVRDKILETRDPDFP